ncbi:hypothetical protein BGW36DRAFT_427364 [Talaromyces proteolyticus]|uniref:Aminoglycoside phosphotransferase domain-containing protein n=1 Tax=Talaromyces proteolyticus TaxID=1131652 RepID=A0AAD4Q0P2_9EURO|nr:uncharacterized protein BGW36DRAFT_427364 [Talaromyces proteolyticus]KAH8697398.1 hypothetical protein BGW36DRAFT_427364 [Talaromyces proteolyticus]
MYPINTSIREISDNSWLIADNLLLSRQQTVSPSLASWSDENGAFFVLSSATAPIPETRPLPATSELQKVYDAGDVSAVWRVGEAFIKLKDLITPKATREHTTLQYLRDKHPLDFNIPEVYYYADLGKRYLIILGRLPGLTLNDIWYEMDETVRQACVSRIANICKSLTTWTGESISGVDGNQLTEEYLIKPRAEMDFDPSHLLKSCDEIGMDCSSFVFYHCDLGPGNILFDRTDCSIGIIDWETAGYVPKEWIRTKFRCSSGMDLPEKLEEVIPQHDWRRRVSQELEKLGFSDVVENWLTWWAVK